MLVLNPTGTDAGVGPDVHVNGALVEAQNLVVGSFGDGIPTISARVPLNVADQVDVTTWSTSVTGVELDPSGFGGNEIALYRVR